MPPLSLTLLFTTVRLAVPKARLPIPSYMSNLAGGGLRAAALVEYLASWHVSRVAPARWKEWLRLKPGEIVATFAALQRLGPHLVGALRSAAVAHRDAEFAEAILANPAPNNYGWAGQGLWSIVRDDQRERLMVKLLFDASKGLDWLGSQSLDEALAAAPRPWSTSLTTLVRHEVQRNLKPRNAGAEAIARLRLKAVATHAPPAFLPELEQQVAGAAPTLDNPSSFDDVLDIIIARRSLDAAFAA